jgi:tetratricopeptide (TPR) repeat protein
MLARAGGNAFYLEELIRAVAQGATAAMPDSVLGMVQARLGALGPESRRILRAASIFGESFWESGVAALLRGDDSAFEVSEWLADLVAREVIERLPESRVAGATEYRFRHALVRDAAYEMLTDDDRRLGHGLAGEWLERAGELEAGILAEHFVRGDRAERAARCFLRAAEQALEHNQLDDTLRLAERAIACGVSGQELGALGAVQAAASFWLGDYAAAERHGSHAIEHVPEGEATWFRVVGTLIAAAGRVGNTEACDRWVSRVSRAAAVPGAEVDELVCLCRGAFQMLFRGQVELARTAIACITEKAARAPRLDPLTAAQIHHVELVRAMLAGDAATCLEHQIIIVDAFERAGDLRNACMEKSSLALHMANTGAVDRAEALARHNLEQRTRDRAPHQALSYARLALAWVLSVDGVAVDEARGLLMQCLREYTEARNPRLMSWSLAMLAKLEHLSGNHAEEEARAAAAVAVVPGWQPQRGWTLALHARALLCLGRAEDALAQARRARQLEAASGVLFDHGLVALVHAQALDACGHTAASRERGCSSASRPLTMLAPGPVSWPFPSTSSLSSWPRRPRSSRSRRRYMVWSGRAPIRAGLVRAGLVWLRRCLVA